jgi:hypothetical protein
MAHGYNPGSSGAKDLENHGLRPSQAKIYLDPISTKKLGMMTHTSNSAYTGGIRRRIVVQASSVKKRKILDKK